jgi:hypothetical protein
VFTISQQPIHNPLSRQASQQHHEDNSSNSNNKSSTMELTESTSTPALTTTAEDLSPLEQDVLDEYERLAENMKKVRTPPIMR